MHEPGKFHCESIRAFPWGNRMWGVLADYVGPILSIGLAVAGSIASADAYSGFKRRMWIGAFITGGVLGAFASIISVHGSHQAYERLVNYITGGEGYCFLKAEITDPKNFLARFPLIIVNEGQYPLFGVRMWISPASAKGNPNDKAYWSMGGVYPEIVYPGTVWAGPRIGLGEYRIEISSRNRQYVQILKVIDNKGEIVQTIDVTDTKNGHLIYRFRPHGYVE